MVAGPVESTGHERVADICAYNTRTLEHMVKGLLREAHPDDFHELEIDVPGISEADFTIRVVRVIRDKLNPESYEAHDLVVVAPFEDAKRKVHERHHFEHDVKLWQLRPALCSNDVELMDKRARKDRSRKRDRRLDSVSSSEEFAAGTVTQYNNTSVLGAKWSKGIPLKLIL